jgi:CBS domain-containing protein
MSERSLRDLFHLIKRVVPEQQMIISIPPDSAASEALSIMSEHNFSQLPVVAGQEVLGVFSYRSFAQKLATLPAKLRQEDALALPVHLFLDKLAYVRVTDELAALFDEFDLKDAVLVGSEEQLLAVVTSVDALKYFYSVASPYYLLRETELAVRELIRQSLSPEELSQCVLQSLKKHYDEQSRPTPAALEDLTLADYVMLLRFRGTWARFEAAFGKKQDFASARLYDLPRIRNDIFHFRRELTAGEYDSLRQSRDWLLARIRQLEASRREQKANG